MVTIGVASPADAGLASVCVADLAVAGALLRAAPVAVVNSPEYSGDVVCWGDRTSPGVWSRVRTRIQDGVDC